MTRAKRPSRRDGLILACALAVALAAIAALERARWGITLTEMRIGDTPATLMARAGAAGPPVVVAHGFAGSREMMQGYGLTLAQAGYRVIAFDFQGHGAHPAPMTGDVAALDGTTARLVAQTRAVMAEARQTGDRVALLGHSMATDVLVRAALAEGDAGPLVLISAFSQAITPEAPRDALLIAGAWEPGLRDFALEAVRMVDPAAAPGETVVRGDTRRAALIAPAVEHVAILHSRAGRRAAVAWLDGFFGRNASAPVPPTGWALLALLGAITAAFGPIARRLLPRNAAAAPPQLLPGRAFALAVVAPALLAPVLAAPVDTRVLPVLVADYLALHLALFGAIQLAVLWRFGHRPGPVAWPAVAALLIWGLGVFGLAIDRYGANFVPTPGRATIIGVLALGAVPFMLADARLTHGAGLWQRVVARLAVLLSLGVAVALDVERLFFLVMILPVIVLFYLVHGLMGRAASAISGPAAPGLALGVILAWALGVSFPLFAHQTGGMP